MNKVILMGRLTREPEMFGQKTKVARFTLAVDRSYGEDETDFFNCVSFGKQAEFVEKYFSKGSQVLVAGRLQMRDWTDKDGNKRISAEVQAENVYFAGTKTEGGQRELPEFEAMDDDDTDLPF